MRHCCLYHRFSVPVPVVLLFGWIKPTQKIPVTDVISGNLATTTGVVMGEQRPINTSEGERHSHTKCSWYQLNVTLCSSQFLIYPTSIWCLCWVWPHLSFAEIFGVRKLLRVPDLLCGIVCVILCWAVSVKHWLVTDRQIDRHTTMAYTALAWYRAVKMITATRSSWFPRPSLTPCFVSAAEYETQGSEVVKK